MNLVINASEIGRQRGGNETFIAGLIEGLYQIKSQANISLLTCQWPTMPTLPFPLHNIGSYSQIPFLLWQQSLALRKLQADWYVSNFFLPPILSCKGAVAVHDLSFRAHPEYFPRFVAWYMRWLTGLAIHQATLVFTGSEFSRQELYRFYPNYQGEVHLIPYGVSTDFHVSFAERERENDLAILNGYGLNPPYIFALGNIHPRKNLARLLEAYLQLQQIRSDLPPMVWSGLPRWESHILMEKAEAAGVVFTGFIKQVDLPVFYRQATVLVYPSLYEGFGLPPVEAMACGTPAIVSNTTSLAEIAGKAALTIDPTDSTAIAEAIAKLLDDEIRCQQLIEDGLNYVQELTWQNTARHLLTAIQTVGKSFDDAR